MVSTWLVVVARTRACSGLSAAGLARMPAAGSRWKLEPISDEQSELAAERHRLAKIGQNIVPGAAALTHPPILGSLGTTVRRDQAKEEQALSRRR
jgi:hypothetical protein